MVPKISFSDVSLKLKLGKRRSTIDYDADRGCEIYEENGVLWVKTLNRINLTIKSGERVALLGPNGAGKTNLIKLLSGIYRPTEGHLAVDGDYFALLSPGSGFSGELSVAQNVENRAGIMGLTKPEKSTFCERVEDACGLGEFYFHPYKKLSNGMKARVGYACASFVSPSILLFDEWISHIDLPFIAKMATATNDLIEKTPIIVFCTHNLSIVDSWATRAVSLDRGAIVEDKLIKRP